MPGSSKPQSQATGAISVVNRNIKALVARRQVEEGEQSWRDRLAGRITRFTGSMGFIAIHVLVYGAWLAINLGWAPGVPRFDPTLVSMTVVASIEAIFLSVFILMTQRRMMAQADRRADLTLQISLLAEYEVTRLITLNKQMAKVLGVEEANEPELEELARDVAPEQVLEQIDQCERHVTDDELSDPQRAAPSAKH